MFKLDKYVYFRINTVVKILMGQILVMSQIFRDWLGLNLFSRCNRKMRIKFC